MKRLKDSSDVPEGRLGTLPKTFHELKVKDKAAFYFRAEERVLPMPANGEGQTRKEVTFCVNQLDLFVTVTSTSQKPHLTKKGKRIN